MKTLIFHHSWLFYREEATNKEEEFRLTFDSSLRKSLYKLENYFLFLQKYLPVSETRKTNMLIVLSEAMTNCVIHGNKFDLNKCIHLSTKLDNYSINFSIEDEGEGFDYHAINHSVDTLDVYNCGRGILIMRYLSDKLTFSNGGRRLDLSFDFK